MSAYLTTSLASSVWHLYNKGREKTSNPCYAVAIAFLPTFLRNWAVWGFLVAVLLVCFLLRQVAGLHTADGCDLVPVNAAWPRISPMWGVEGLSWVPLGSPCAVCQIKPQLTWPNSPCAQKPQICSWQSIALKSRGGPNHNLSGSMERPLCHRCALLCIDNIFMGEVYGF